MSRYGGWAPYVPVAARRKKAAREMEKLRKKGIPVEPVVITGRTIATTFWGKAWCKNLESYHDYENRIPRGRTYVRNGSVVDLKIKTKEVLAMVSGSSIYKVKINIKALPKNLWQAICNDCSVGIDSLVELLQGRFNKGVMDRLCRQDNGLFPTPSEIKFSCSCPDYASMCKHIAAALYGIGARLDEKPELLFLLRAVDHNDLLAHVDTAVPFAKKGPKAGKLLETDDISQLFGLDMAEGEIESTIQKSPRPVAKTVSKPSTAKKPKQHPLTDLEKEKNLWKDIEELISRRTASGYSKATDHLLKLYRLATKTKKMPSFSRRFSALRVRHQRKNRFIERLDAIKEFETLKSKKAKKTKSKQDVSNKVTRKQMVDLAIEEFVKAHREKSPGVNKGEKQIKKIQRSEKESLLKKMDDLAKKAGFGSAAELMGSEGSRSPRKDKGTKASPMYKHPTEEKTWSGRGRVPNWVLDYEKKKGKNRDDLLTEK
jgi:uncharacterized Zn finger protein/DNA-binding protein H-NS